MWEKRPISPFHFARGKKKINIAELWLCILILPLQGLDESHLTKDNISLTFTEILETKSVFANYLHL